MPHQRHLYQMQPIAIVHDYLTQSGGAERVALALANMFPQAPVYTSMYEPDGTFAGFRQHDVRTTSLQRWVPATRFRWAAPLIGPAFQRLDLSGFDRVLVSTSGFAHHIQHPNAFVYCHTPPHFLYAQDEYFGEHHPLRTMTQPLFTGLVARLKRADQQAAAYHQHYAANSKATARRIAEVYGKHNVPVIYPPLHTGHLPAMLTPVPSQNPKALVVARLLPYKRVDVAIAACLKAGIALTIVGEGPEEQRLRALAGGDRQIHFLGKVPDEQLAELFEQHCLVLMAGIEDFGYAPIEANYAGRPVIARTQGGAAETVVDGHNGVLVKDDNPATWAQAINKVLCRDWNAGTLRAATKPFQPEMFANAIGTWIGPIGQSTQPQSSQPQ